MNLRINKSRHLIEIMPDEVSLVKKPANRRKFILIKQEKTMENLKAVLDAMGIDSTGLVIDEKDTIGEQIETISKSLSAFPPALGDAIKLVVRKALSVQAAPSATTVEDDGNVSVEAIVSKIVEGMSKSMTDIQEKVISAVSEKLDAMKKSDPATPPAAAPGGATTTVTTPAAPVAKTYTEDEVKGLIAEAAEEAVKQYIEGTKEP